MTAIEPQERVLVVDDDPGMRYAASRVLGARYAVEVAGGSEEALARVGRRPAFQVALVDLQLPDGDGYELCRRLRRASPDTDVILMTGSVSQPDEKLYRALEGDAFYFVFKPFDRRVLLALVERCLRLQRERRAKERFADELAHDLEKARRFQTSLMPAAAVTEGGWRVEGRFSPCDALGGDFWVCLPDHAGGLVVAVADVVGHGVGAAMYAGMLRSVLDTARRRDPRPEQVAAELATGLDFFSGRRFASLFFAHLAADGSVGYFSAGHPPALRLGAPGEADEPVELASTGVVLNTAFAGLERKVVRYTAAAGERLLLYSDGIVEALDPAGRELGDERLARLLVETRGEPPAAVLDRILAALADHVGGRPATDDATLVLVERS